MVGQIPLGVGQGVVYLGSVLSFSIFVVAVPVYTARSSQWWVSFPTFLPVFVSLHFLNDNHFDRTRDRTAILSMMAEEIELFEKCNLYFFFWELSASLWSPSLLGCLVVFFLFSVLALCVFYTLIFCHMNSWKFFSSNLQFVITQLAVYFVVQMFLIS